MHHSTKLNAQAVAVTCYLDESSTDGGAIAVVGGLALNKSGFIRLNKKWNRMIDKFNLHPAVHMKDFGGHGRFGHLSFRDRLQILNLASQIIIDCNIFTIAVTLSQEQYRSTFPLDSPSRFSQYVLCFIGCVLGNQQIAEKQGYRSPVAFVLDQGNAYAAQVSMAHNEFSKVQKEQGHDMNLGSLTFEDDRRITAIQAADVVCWAARRRAAGFSFSGGFEPLEEILNRLSHNECPMSVDALQNILEAVKLADLGQY